MSYSRRNFLKAAGFGVVLTAVSGELSCIAVLLRAAVSCRGCAVLE